MIVDMKNINTFRHQRGYIAVYIILAVMSLGVVVSFSYWYYLSTMSDNTIELPAPKKPTTKLDADFSLPTLPYSTNVATKLNGKTIATGVAIYDELGNVRITATDENANVIDIVFTDQYAFTRNGEAWIRTKRELYKGVYVPSNFHVLESSLKIYHKGAVAKSDGDCLDPCKRYSLSKTGNSESGEITTQNNVVQKAIFKIDEGTKTITYTNDGIIAIEIPTVFTQAD